MTRITASRPFLYILLASLVVLSIIERIKIGGWILEQAWWVLILFPALHSILHLTYLLKIHYIKRKHLGVILLSHIGYFLFFIFQRDSTNKQIKIILPEIIKAYNVHLSNQVYDTLIFNYNIVLWATLAFFVLAEALFAVRIRQYIKTEAVVITK